MAIPFTCPHCGHRTQVAPQYVGQSGPCVNCGAIVTVPAPNATGGATAAGTTAAGVAAGGVAAAPVSGQTSRTTSLVVVGLVLLALLFAVAILTAAILPAVFMARQAAARARSLDHLRQIQVALDQYQLEYGQYPPDVVRNSAGQPMHSWRVLLLPYLGEQELYDSYDLEQPWNGPTNSLLLQRMPEVYRPVSSARFVVGETAYFVVSGPGTLFDGQPRTPADIADGPSAQLLVVEAAGSSVAWAEPGDLDIRELAAGRGPGTAATLAGDDGSIKVAFADGQVVALPGDTDPEALESAALIADGGSVEWQDGEL